MLVGDRGMITAARIAAIKELNDTGTDFGWITALRAPAIAKLAADDGPLQMSLFDTHDLAEITHPDYPHERLIACRNPALAAERARKRNELLAATETALARIAERVERGSLAGAGKIGEAVGQIVNKYKVSKHFHRTITDTSFAYERDHAAITAEAASTASTSCAPRCPPPTSTPPRWSPGIRTWPMSNATSAASKPTTSTYAPSTTGCLSASKPTY
ncbi:putative transposase [Mycobacterium kansasii 662]|uniref:Putative transposase n=1 Tax=Mycobacterium kansasii 662 TaxID=1299326 RepID=X7XV57_MYCKA|nr:putative transposase [Mycobacterium kansasii 662]